jgi:hypothetical protein
MENTDFDGINAACRALEKERARADWKQTETWHFLTFIVAAVGEHIPDPEHPLRIEVGRLVDQLERSVN